MNLRSVLKLINLLEHKIQNKITQKILNEESFRNNLQSLYIFYGKKLINTCKTDSNKEFIYDSIEDLVNNQFLHGYHLIYSLQQDDPTIFDNLKQLTKNTLKANLKILLNRLFDNKSTEESYEWEKNDISLKLIRSFIKEIPDVYDVLNDVLFKAALEGAYSALNEQVEYKYETDMPNTIIGDPLDTHYLNPEIYGLIQYFDDSVTLIDLYKLSSKTDLDEWCGSIEYLKIQSNQNKNLIISVETTINNEECTGIVSKLLEIIPQNELEDANIRVQRIQDIEIFNYIQK